MPPVAGSISWFGVRPPLAEGRGVVPTFRTAFTASTTGMPVCCLAYAPIRPLTWLGLRLGRRSIMSAATPATTGAAIDVPPARKYSPETLQVGHSAANELSGASVE